MLTPILHYTLSGDPFACDALTLAIALIRLAQSDDAVIHLHICQPPIPVFKTDQASSVAAAIEAVLRRGQPVPYD